MKSRERWLEVLRSTFGDDERNREMKNNCKNDGQCPHCNPIFAALVQASPRDQAQFQFARARAEGTLTLAASRPRPRLSPKAQADFDAAVAVMNANAAARAVPVIAEAPEPPSLVAAVNARRAMPGSGIPIGTVPEPVVFGGGRRPYPVTLAAAHEEPPDPPNLTDAIRNRRSR